MSSIVIGLGTDHRGDDAAGLEVARRLEHRTAIAHAKDPLGVIEPVSPTSVRSLIIGITSELFAGNRIGAEPSCTEDVGVKSELWVPLIVWVPVPPSVMSTWVPA